MKYVINNKIKEAGYFVAISLFPLIVFWAANFDFSGIFARAEVSNIPQSWLDEYGLEINSASDLEKDADGDGLNLLEEYENSTDPKKSDTDGDGYPDGKEVRDGYNPHGEGRLDTDNDGMADFLEKKMGLDPKRNDAQEDPDKDGLNNIDEYAHLTDPKKSDTDGDGYSDLLEIQNGYDPTAPGDAKLRYELEIPKLGLNVPVVWSKSNEEESLQSDLEKGVAHLPGTGIPGTRGNAVISGHSSNYAWKGGSFNHVFKDLNNLQEGDEIIVKAFQKNGQTFKYAFKVGEKEVTTPDDARIFSESVRPAITLVTCWPLNTNWKRLFIRAEEA